MSNRQRIIDTALSLFNAQGTSAVSTNHIAEAAEISPGNLYYHFKNKEEIIRTLFENLFNAWDVIFQLPLDREPSLADLDSMISANYQLIWDYRFAYREMAALLQNDPELQRNYLAVRQRGYEGFKELFKAFVEAGVLIEPEDPEEISVLTELCWIVSEQWPINLELNGKPFDAKGITEGIALMQTILKPYRK